MDLDTNLSCKEQNVIINALLLSSDVETLSTYIQLVGTIVNSSGWPPIQNNYSIEGKQASFKEIFRYIVQRVYFIHFELQPVIDQVLYQIMGK